MPRLHHVAPAMPASVGPLRHRLGAFACKLGAADDTVAAIELAASEAMTNAIVHAFAGRAEPGRLTVTAFPDGEALWVVVGDDGDGMRPRPDSPGLGLGLPLITQLAESLEVRTLGDGGTEVAMRFALVTPDA